MTSLELKNWHSEKNRMKYLSHQIQNEMITLLGNAIFNVFLKEVRESAKYSIIMDETSDVATLEQVTCCFRSINPTTFAVREDFIGFVSAEKVDGEALFAILKEKLVQCGLPLNKIRGQSYDGAGP